MEREFDRQISGGCALMRTLNQFVVVKKELSQKEKFSIYWLINIPTLIYGHKLLTLTERTRYRVQASEMIFLYLFLCFFIYWS